MENIIGQESIELEFPEADIFNKKMEELLKYVKKPTSQELFVIFHLAYAAMNGVEVADAGDYVIYWEWHGIKRMIHPYCTYWLASKNVQGLVITNSRNSIVRTGGLIKCLKSLNQFHKTFVLRDILETPVEWNIEESAWEALEFKFEDLKCNPENVMEKICSKTGILLSEFNNGFSNNEQVEYCSIEQIMQPVYNIYEEYLSEYDRMRIALLTSNWQKKKGYPYVSCKDYTRKDLQEIYLKEFRFEKQLKFYNEEEYMRYRYMRKRWLRQRLDLLRLQLFIGER